MAEVTVQFQNHVQDLLAGKRLIVVSNREPYVHTYSGDDIVVSKPVSGLVTGLEPIMEACGGTWVAQGTGDADRAVVDSSDRVEVPPGSPSYRLRRVWLTRDEEDGYYYGFANRALWPLCHQAYVRPVFDAGHWAAYQEVNRRFADVILEEAGTGPTLVFIQDYHFALLPGYLKQARPGISTAQFWHIPWPAPDVFAVCPWADEIVTGLLSNDVLGFQTSRHRANFEATRDRLHSEAGQRSWSASNLGTQTVLGAFPIGVDFDGLSRAASTPEVLQRAERFRREHALRGQTVLLGVDRLDYTKGIAERFEMFERLLVKHPEYRGRVTLVQAGPLSRIEIPEYQQLNDTLYHLMIRINRRFGAGQWQPIRMLKHTYGIDELLSFYRLADVCTVTPLHDGMNLVAKEFIAARSDDDGVLLLSRFAGAAEELTDAVQVNPYDAEGGADAMHYAIQLSETQRRRRMQAMRDRVARDNIYRWAVNLLEATRPAFRYERPGFAAGSAQPPRRNGPQHLGTPTTPIN